MEEFKYLGTTLTNQNSIPEEIKSRLSSGNACYHSVQNRLSSRLLTKNLKIKIYRNIILPIVFYGSETWSLTLREENGLGQPNPVHILTSHLLEIHTNIIHPSTPRFPQWSLSLRFPHQDPIHPPLLSHTRHMPSPSHSSRFYHPHNIG